MYVPNDPKTDLLDLLCLCHTGCLFEVSGWTTVTKSVIELLVQCISQFHATLVIPVLSSEYFPGAGCDLFSTALFKHEEVPGCSIRATDDLQAS